jgi:hypothetical protein
MLYNCSILRRGGVNTVKARYCNNKSSTEQKGRKEKVTKQRWLASSLCFSRPIIQTQLTDLDLPMEDIKGSTIWPMLIFEDKMNFMQVNKCTHLFFNKTIQIDRLLHHVFYGQPKNVKAMIKRDPQLLLQTGSVTCKHTGETLRGTPLRIALRVKDLEMIALFQKHMDLEEIEAQQKAQFPEGYRSYQEEEKTNIREGYAILEETFEAIFHGEIKAYKLREDKSTEGSDKLSMDKKTESALNHLRDYLKPKGVIETGMDIRDALLAKALELYEANYDRFSIPSQKLTLKSPKNQLAWRLVGIIQLHVKINNIQAMCGGPHDAIQKMKAGKPQARALTFEIWDGYDWGVKSNFLDMVSDPSSGLGVDYACYARWACGERAQHGLGSALGVTKSFSVLITIKNTELAKLILNPARPEAGKCLVM